MKCPVTVAKAGLYEFKVTLSNAAGTGDNASLPSMYIGPDAPRYVENLALTRGEQEGEFIVTWDAPSEGAHGGYVDPAAVKYRVRRLPSFDLLSEDAVSPFTDTFISEEPVKCSYEVMPYVDEEIKGLPLTTPSVMTGKPFTLPYEEDFTKASSANLWTVVDANGDGHSWEYQWDFGYYRAYDNENPKDDWLISPYISLDAGYRYKLTYKVRTIATEKLEVKMGLGLTPEDMTQELAAMETIPDTDYSWLPRETEFTVDASGNYHIGFHAATDNPAEALAAYVDDVRVENLGSSIDRVPGAESLQAPVMAVNGAIVALSPVDLAVYTPDGRLEARASLAAGETLALPAGLHIVVAEGASPLKLQVK